VKSHIRELAGVLLSLALVVAPGCSQDNEAEAQKLSKNMGDPGPSVDKNKTETPSLPNDPVARYKAQQKAPYHGMGPGYPNAKK
jgi:hypothetical protein